MTSIDAQEKRKKYRPYHELFLWSLDQELVLTWLKPSLFSGLQLEDKKQL